MQIDSALSVLKGYGYQFNVEGKTVQVRPPARQPPPDSAALLDQLRLHKAEVLGILMYRGFTEVPANEGDLHVVTVDVTNEREMLRWAAAVDTGLIALLSRVLCRTGLSTATVRYRCSFPPEWLPDAITKAAKGKYNHTVERIQKGEKWLQEHSEDHPEYQRAYDGYLALYENLRKLYVAIDEPLAKPMEGYTDEQ